MKYLLGEKLKFDWKIVTITIVSTLLLMVDYYHRLTPYKYWDRVILYLVIPLLIVVFLFRENPQVYGFGLGDWKAGLLITAIGIACMAPVIYYLGHGDAAMQDYYKPYNHVVRILFTGVLAREHLDAKAHLLQVVLAARTTRGLAGTRKRRQENRRQNGDDGDYHQQLDKCKTLLLHS